MENEFNPFLQENKLEFDAVPFDKIKPGHFIPALNIGIGKKDKIISKITENSKEPTFENTILEYEKSSELIEKVARAFSILHLTNSTEELRKIAPKIEEIITETSTKDYLNPKLFSRIKEIYKKRDRNDLDNDDSSLIQRTYETFIKYGANCPEESKERLTEIKIKLSKLYLKFSENLQKEAKNFNFLIENESKIASMPEDDKNAAKEIARENGKEGFMFLPNRSMTPLFLGHCNDRNLRREFFTKKGKMCCGGGETDNRKIVQEISNLRFEIAKIFGKKAYGEIPIQFNLLNNLEDINKLVSSILEKSLPKAKKEVFEIAEFAKKEEGPDFILMPEDFEYYSQKYKAEKFNIETSKVKEYFELEKTLDAMFKFAMDKYFLSYKKRTDLPIYQEDVWVYEVLKNGKHLGLVYFDLFSRAGEKIDGAWMNEITGQFNYPFTQRPQIHLCTNFTKPKKESKCLLTQDEVETLLHEFGHVLHGLLSNVKYSSLCGTNVPRDFVEMPSQVMEGFFFEKEFLNNCAKHYKTGNPLPEEIYSKLLSLKNFQKGYWYARQMGLCLIDAHWNTLNELFEGDVLEKEKEILKKLNLFPEDYLRYRSVSFLHPFGHGYEMNYHSYSYSEILDADMFNFLKENNFSRESFQLFEKEILSKGGTINYLDAYKKVTGHLPKIDSLFKRAGFE
jgi:peptidyl-dipeptidase Dcp